MRPTRVSFVHPTVVRSPVHGSGLNPDQARDQPIANRIESPCAGRFVSGPNRFTHLCFFCLFVCRQQSPPPPHAPKLPSAQYAPFFRFKKLKPASSRSVVPQAPRSNRAASAPWPPPRSPTPRTRGRAWWRVHITPTSGANTAGDTATGDERELTSIACRSASLLGVSSSTPCKAS